jgi:hypothetical protein
VGRRSLRDALSEMTYERDLWMLRHKRLQEEVAIHVTCQECMNEREAIEDAARRYLAVDGSFGVYDAIEAEEARRALVDVAGAPTAEDRPEWIRRFS